MEGKNMPKWEAWARVLEPNTRRGEGGPVYSAFYRNRMRVSERPEHKPTGAGNLGVEYGSSILQSTSTSAGAHVRAADGIRRHAETDAEQQGRWGSVAGREWSLFEESGFSFSSTSRPASALSIHHAHSTLR